MKNVGRTLPQRKKPLLWNEYSFQRIKEAPVLTPPATRRAGRRAYRDLVCAFDIETTRIPGKDDSVMYIWQCCIEDDIIIGRTWDEYRALISRIEEQLGIEYIIMWVHNLSYEFSFLCGIFEFDDTFNLEKRKVCRATSGHIEYRCSYIQSNMSLDAFCKKMQVVNKKIEGFDYNKVRFPWTELTDLEIDYCINDVVGLVQAIKKQMSVEGDTLQTIPMTNTGYVRRDVKTAMKWYSYKNLDRMKPSIELWRLLRLAFRGGNTHANRYYVGKILHNVYSNDFSSSYPYVMCNCKYPMSKFVEDKDLSKDRLLYLVNKSGRAVLARISLKNVRLHDKYWGFPYISLSKCKDYEGRKAIENPVNDNGRVLSADYIMLAATDIDLRIIFKEYDCDAIIVHELYHASYDYLPEPIVKTMCEYYRRKTELKGAETEFEQLLYDKSKNKINSGYGMMAQNPVRHSVLWDKEGGFHYDSEKDEILLEEYNKRAFLMYQWGVWVTAWARYRLECALDIAGDKAIYVDTDSVKHLCDIDFSTISNDAITRSSESGSHATDRNGKEHYMGTFDAENGYERFVTWGAKKYAFEQCGDIGITVAGVAKKIGAQELKEKGGLEAFNPGLVFSKAGGLESVYNDHSNYRIWIDGHWLQVTPNVCLRPSTYTLGITDDFAYIVNNCGDLVEKLDNIY